MSHRKEFETRKLRSAGKRDALRVMLGDFVIPLWNPWQDGHY